MKSEDRPTIVSCPTCARKVSWTRDNPHRPFCSERCKLIDLGEWFTEEKRIPGEETPPEG